MEPAVRGARIEPTIAATRLETAFFASQDSEFPNRQTALCRSKRCRRERSFWTQRPEAKNLPERPLLSAETGNSMEFSAAETEKLKICSRDGKCHQRPKVQRASGQHDDIARVRPRDARAAPTLATSYVLFLKRFIQI